MVACKSITYCCRETTSHDFVVKDYFHNTARFCINGAEIPDHRVTEHVVVVVVGCPRNLYSECDEQNTQS